MTAASLLESVAQHELELLRQVAVAEEEGRALVEQAHADAAVLLQEDQARLEEEIAGMRREAAAARAQERQEIQRRMEARVAEIRQSTADKLEHVKADILRQLLPSTSGEVSR